MSNTVPCLNPEVCGVQSHIAGSGEHIKCTKQLASAIKNNRMKLVSTKPATAPTKVVPAKSTQGEIEWASGRRLTDDEKEFLTDIYTERYGEGDSLVEYRLKKTSGMVKFPEATVIFDKPSIKTEFWFGEHGYDYDEVRKTANKAGSSEDFFIDSNISQTSASRQLQLLDECEHNLNKPWIAYRVDVDNDSEGYVVFGRDEEDARNNIGYNGEWKTRALSEKETEQYREFLESEINAFKKRLQTYLKRFGMSKVTANTFWADR